MMKKLPITYNKMIELQYRSLFIEEPKSPIVLTVKNKDFEHHFHASNIMELLNFANELTNWDVETKIEYIK